MAPIFVLIVVVFIHELGHFLVARWCGVKVSTFSIGFGPELFGFTDRKGTRWKFGAVPLGGYVKFMDDENASSVPSREKREQMSEQDRAGAFQFKPLWQRAAVVVAGPMANFLSAILMFAAVVYISGQRIEPAILKVRPLNPAVLGGLKTGDLVGKVDGKEVSDFKALEGAIANAAGREITIDVRRDGVPVTVKVTPEARAGIWVDGGKVETRGSLGIEPDGIGSERKDPATLPPRIKVLENFVAVQAGLQTGDRVLSVDGRPVTSFPDFSQAIAGAAGQEIAITVERAGGQQTIKLTPQALTVPDGFGGHLNRGIIGVELGVDRASLPVTHPNIGRALGMGCEQTWGVVSSTLGYIRGVVAGKQAADKIGGLPTIIDVSNQIAKYGFLPLVQLIGLVSVSIGLLNLFPIPLLDGGHLMYYAAEAVRGRPLSDETQEFGFRIGLAIVSSLMVFALWNDRFRMLGWVENLMKVFS